MDPFELSDTQLQEISALYAERIRQGLKQDGHEIACLPTYLGLPDGKQSGQALVIDTGGTNMRAALVELQAKDGQLLAGPISKKVPDGRGGSALSADHFFSAQAQLTQQLEADSRAVPLGYCFSYPARNEPTGDAVLLKWTKGLRIDGVVGQSVGKMLREQLLEQDWSIPKYSVLNDTVASLLGGVHLYGETRFGQNYIGLILGTGTNMAGVFSPDILSKVESSGAMLVNLESGAFHPPHLNEYDDALDRESNNPGQQRFEKAASGHYLWQLFRKALPDFEIEANASELVRLRDSSTGEPAQLAASILRRSARLVAAGLAALNSLYPAEHETAVLGEGGLFWGDPNYVPTVEETLKILSPERKLSIIRQRENVNLLGAASAALA